MDHNCERHPFEVADGVCRSCHGSFCADCVLYPFGTDKEPFCKPCAIAAGGIRSTAGNIQREATGSRKAKARGGGLLGRFRRGQNVNDEQPALTPEEMIEREATEARGLLDAQRLPSEPDEDPEPELPPAPNIAPPGGFDDETEMTHREMPDEIAGGLDLRGAPDAASRPIPDESAETEMPTSDEAVDAGNESQPSPTTSAATDDAVDEPRFTAPDTVGSPPGAVEPEPEPEPAASATGTAPPVDRSSQTPIERPSAGTQTADGIPLFAAVPEPPRPPDDLFRSADDAGEVEDPEGPEAVPATVGARPDSAAPDGQDETRELLRRIADLRGR